MTHPNNIRAKLTNKQERRDPRLRNRSKSTDYRFNPLQDKKFIKNNKILAGLALGH